MVALNTPKTSTSMQHHLLWAAMLKIGQKEFDSKQVQESTTHSIDLQITGKINGRPISESIESVVSIGESQEKSSSVNPQMPQLVAWILSKLNTATRTRILEDLPSEFVELGAMPESDEHLVNDTKSLLKQLRQVKTVTARGPIRCQYTVQELPAESRSNSRVATHN